MASNIGTFRDAIVVYYKSTSTSTDMGSEVLTFTSNSIFADVNQMSLKQLLYYGLDTANEAYKVICRAPSLSRPVKVTYKAHNFKVVDSFIDKRGLLLTMFVTRFEQSEETS